ncbi:YihY/virulence factor BrkB family protein [Blastococcus sp. LR1]|uniref:YihY/virulence factor BrkB family protein n=1 Tax=Blastococcus sp. LR1 TaxID=2877000 RepID=UPI001CCA5145|nr:YihY/virulence factor BrkB family protein [Blastococcus sp. LR1]MCA0146164.1 YihY/virulence factor BrkB family protein [Blastococcus sp. LR1]
MSTASSGDAPARKAWPARLWDRVESTIDAGRARYGWFDHLARAGGRYQRTQGDLMAAGVTYFAFLALFPVLLLVASVIGLVIAGDELLQRELFTTIRETFPGGLGRRLVEQLSGAIDSAGFVGLIALGGFLYAGLRTMDKLRVGMERIWKGRVDEPEFLRDNLQDVVALVALGGLGVASLGVTGLVSQGTSRVLDFLDLADEPGYGVLTWLLGITLAMAGNIVVFLWMLRVVPAVSTPVRRLLPGALFGAVGFEVLKLVGGYYLSLISDSVTASAFGGAVGVLVWINLVARFSFFTAAWTATGLAGEPSVPAPVDPPVDVDDGPVPHPAASR